MDATATAARLVIQAALAATTPVAPPATTDAPDAGATAAAQPTATTTATPDAVATAAAREHEMATAVVATLTAQPADTPTPTATPDATATAAALAAQVAQSVGATLTAEARARPTDTPTRAATKTPTVPPTRPPPTRAPAFYFLSLAAVANNSTHEGYVNPPQGEVTLGGVPFSLPPGTNSVTTQADSLPDNPAAITLGGLGIPNPRAVYLLITGGNTRAEFAGAQVGEIRLQFLDGAEWSMALVPGANLREWKSYGTHNVTTIASGNAQQVWSGANHFDSGVATIDLLTIQVPTDLQDKTLASIEVADRSQEWAGSANPALNLIGVTVQAQ